MKILLKSTSVILALLILVLAVPVFAADSYNVTASSAQNIFENVSEAYKAGDEFDLKIYAQAEDYLLNGDIKIRFDSDSLYAEEATEGFSSLNINGDGDAEYQENNGYISCTFSSMNGTDYRTEKELLSVHFQVKNSFSKDEIVSFDVSSLAGIQNPGNPKTMLNYVKSGAVVEANKDRFFIRAELTKAPEQPTEAPT